MNILLTSVGRRAYMVQYFKEALKGKGQVHVSNSDDISIAFQYADKCVVSPLIYDPQYIPFLIDYCKNNHIDMLLSFFDIDLPILSRHKEEFEAVGTKLVVSNLPFVEICNDKWKTCLFLQENDIPAPKTFLKLLEVLKALDSGVVSYPVILKPRFGCGSIALSIAEDESSLVQMYRKISKEVMNSYLKYESAAEEEKVIFQEYMRGQEYGVDVINDLNGKFRNAIVKKKIAMRSGETDIAETVSNSEIFVTAQKIASASRHIGNLDMDIFLMDNKPYVLEMNARFGGGYPFSHVAGCNLPEALVAWCEGRDIDDSLLQAAPGILSYKEITITRRRV